MNCKFTFVFLGSLAAAAAFATGDHSKGYKPDGTNVWIGAASGGNWSDVANWRAESASGYSVAELMKRHCFYDFSALASGAIVTMDYTNGTFYVDRDVKNNTTNTTFMVYGIRFAGQAGDKWTVTAASGANRALMINNGYYEVYGGELLWNVPAYTGNYPYQGIRKYGDGVFRSAAAGNLWETSLRLYEGTYAVTNSAMEMTNFELWMSNNTTFACEKNYQVARVTSPNNVSSATTKMTILPGYKLTIDTGFGQGPSSFSGDVVGSNCTWRVQGGARHSFYRGDKANGFSFSGLLEAYFGEFVFGTPQVPVGVQSAVSVEVPGAGRVRFFQDQTVSTLGGTTAGIGGVIFSNATFTVGTTACATSTVYNGCLEGGAFVKDGADYELTLGGANCYTGATRVKAGTLSVGRPFMRTGLAYKWSFEDKSVDYMADSSPCASLPLMARAGGTDGLPNQTTGAYFLPEFVADGVCGQALRFPAGSAFYRGAGVKYGASKTGDIKSDTADQRPTGTGHPFTCSFWVRPMVGQCGKYPHFLNYGSIASEGSGSVNYDGFNFGSINDGSNRPFNTLGMYVRSEGWCVTGEAGMPGKVVQYCFNQNPSPIYDGKWHHIVGTYDGNLMKLYVDGQKKAEAVRGAVSFPSKAMLCMGSYSNEQYKDSAHKFAGDLDEIQVLGVAWTDAEVAAEFAAKKPQPDAALPAPLAHWTFDQLESDFTFKDVTGGGIDLQVTFTNTTRWTKSAQVVLEDVKYPDNRGSKLAYFPKLNNAHTGARLEFKEGVSLADKFTAGGSFTLTMRYSGALEKRWFFLGTSTSSSSGNLNTFYLGDGGCPRQQVMHAGKVGDVWLYDTGHWTGITSSPNGDPCWVSLAIVYDAKQRLVYYYRDGKLVVTSTATEANFLLNPTKLLIGGNGNDCWSNMRFDDMRFYDIALSGEQVRRVAHAVNYSAAGGDAAAEAASTPIPTDSPVIVDAGATLAVRAGTSLAVASLSGAGTVKVDDGAALTAGSLADFTGGVTGGGDIAFASGITLSVSDSTDIATSGKVTLPASGTFSLADPLQKWVGGKFPLATCSAYQAPADLSQWTFTPAVPGVKDGAMLLYENGTLYLKIKRIGTAIFVK